MGSEFTFKSTKDISVSDTIIDQVIGQEEAVEVIKKASKQRRHVLLIGEPGTGKCVGKDTLIQLSDGSARTAEELYTELSAGKRFLALAVNPDLSLAHSALLRAEKTTTEAVTLCTNTGKSITVSNEHPFLTLGKNGVRWVFAHELKKGDVIAAARRIETIEQMQDLSHLPRYYAPTTSHSNVKRIEIPATMNEEFSEFCGYLWSEGYIARNRSLTFTNSEEHLIERFTKLARDLFHLHATVRHMPEKHAYVATIESSTLAHALRLMGWGKQIPLEIMKSPRNVVKTFLRSYFDGDGSATNRGFEVTTKNPKVAQQLQALLLRFDITCVTKVVRKRATNSTMLPKEYVTLFVYDAENLVKLCEIGFSIERKMKRLESLCLRKPQSNIDKLPHIGELLFELKEKLRLTSDDIGIEIHQWQRYLQGTRTPTRVTVEKALHVFAHRYVALREFSPLLLNDGSIELERVWQELDISKASIARRLGTTTREIDLHPQLAQCTHEFIQECITQEIEDKIVGLHQLVHADVVWERITVLKSAGMQELFDFEADLTHNFLANNIFVHNSMLGLALAELLPKEKLVDILSFPNVNDENQPLIRTVKAGEGRKIVTNAKMSGDSMFRKQGVIMLILAIVLMIVPWWVFKSYTTDYNSTVGAIMFLGTFIGAMVFFALAILFMNLGKKVNNVKVAVPKIIVDNYQNKEAPFYDATGAHAGALLGDVLHDPFQSGGLGTPAHERVVAGMIHKAHMGVLFVDEIATLQPHTQQELLTSLQEGKYAITGQSERSAGAMVRTESVPCNFILVAAGNLETIQNLHPALRSRIRGYGYEVYMKETMPDTKDNRMKIAKFVAQEVIKDKRIPHFNREAVEYIVNEAKRRASRKGHLTLRFRELGGVIRAAGDLAVEQNSKLVEPKHIVAARELARPLEQQIADQYIERKKEYEVIITTGKLVGRVNGLAVIGSGSTFSGIILPIESQVTPGGKAQEIIATGKLGDIAKEAVKNVSAIIKSYFGEDIKEKYDIYVQFLQTYEGVEGDSASIAVAITIISSIADAPIKQNYAVTGSLSVRGDVLPVGGVGAKVEAAIEAGIENVIVPDSNLKDIVIDEAKLKKIRIIPVKTIIDVVGEMIDWKDREEIYARFKSKGSITNGSVLKMKK